LEACQVSDPWRLYATDIHKLNHTEQSRCESKEHVNCKPKYFRVI